MTAQRGDFVSPPASSPTDRRDADDAIDVELNGPEFHCTCGHSCEANSQHAPGTDSRDSLREAIARALFGRAHGGWPGSLEAADEVLALLRRDLSAETGPVARQSCGCEGYRVHHHGCTKFAAPGTEGKKA